jgi:hypothetical protein
MRRNPSNLLLLAWLAIFLLPGCNLNTQSPVFPPTLSPVPPGKITPLVTVVSAFTRQPAATIALLPTESKPVTTGGDTRIEFAAGATYAGVSGDLPPGGQASFLISAGKGQLMMLGVGSPDRDVYLEVSGADGSLLASRSARVTTWQGILPYTEDYRITLTAGGSASHYDLGVTIPAIIQFSPGATSTLVQGQVSGQANVNYMLYALAGQKMSIMVKSPNSDVQLTLSGVTDGLPIVRSASGANQWSGILPATQYYMIVAVTPGKDSTFVLQISIQ